MKGNRIEVARFLLIALVDRSKVDAQINNAQSMRNEGLNYRPVGRFFSGDQRYVFNYRGRIAVSP
jgi:hypothetical protein